MKAVNLLPREYEQVKKGPSRPVVAGCAAAVLATVVLAGGYLQASSALGKKNAELGQARVRLAAIPRPVAPPSTATGIPEQRQARVAALSSALSQRVAWDRVLREVSLVLPDDVWLSQLSGQAPAAAADPTAVTTGPAGQGLHIVGFTYSQAGVARLLSRLDVIPELERVTLNSSTQSPTDGTTRSVVQFDIGADLRTASSTPPSTS